MGYYPKLIMDNQIEKTMATEMEPVRVEGIVGILKVIMVLDFLCDCG